MKKPDTILSLKECNSGIIALEFALILPVLVLLFIGIVEISRLAIFEQKIQKATYDLADFVTQNEEVTAAMLDSYAATLNRLMDPYTHEGTAIFSSIAAVADDDATDSAADGAAMDADVAISASGSKTAKLGCKGGCIVWQYKVATGTPHNSKIGVKGGKATFPNGYKLTKTQNIIVVEVFSRFRPMFSFSSEYISSMIEMDKNGYAIYMPRLDSLLEPPV